jgi:hypothetical protein
MKLLYCSYWAKIVLVVILTVSSLAIAEKELVKQNPDDNSLYGRIGGGEIISNVVDDYMERLWADPKISFYFRGMGIDTKNKLRKKNLQVEILGLTVLVVGLFPFLSLIFNKKISLLLINPFLLDEIFLPVKVYLNSAFCFTLSGFTFMSLRTEKK